MADQVGTEAQNGARLRCGVCRSEAIVTKSEGALLSCCGEPMEILFAGA